MKRTLGKEYEAAKEGHRQAQKTNILNVSDNWKSDPEGQKSRALDKRYVWDCYVYDMFKSPFSEFKEMQI